MRCAILRHVPFHSSCYNPLYGSCTAFFQIYLSFGRFSHRSRQGHRPCGSSKINLLPSFSQLMIVNLPHMVLSATVILNPILIFSNNTFLCFYFSENYSFYLSTVALLPHYPLDNSCFLCTCLRIFQYRKV